MMFSINAISIGVGSSSSQSSLRFSSGGRTCSLPAFKAAKRSASRFRAVNDPSWNTSTLNSFSNKNGTRRMVNAPNTTKARGRGSSTHVVVVFAGGVKCASSKSSSSTSDDGDDEEKEEKEEKADKMEKGSAGNKNEQKPNVPLPSPFLE